MKDPTTLLQRGHGPLVGVVNRVKVARRDLTGFPMSANLLAHSALLLETTDGKMYICEYQSDSRVYLTHIKPAMIYKHVPKWGSDRFEARGASGNFLYTNYECTFSLQCRSDVLKTKVHSNTHTHTGTVQHVGTYVNPNKGITPDKVKSEMARVTGWRKYDRLSHNCHYAQESTRKAFGWM
mgnify:FL=1